MKKKLSCVLLVDDDEPTNFLNRIIIEEAECTNRIEVADSGPLALAYLQKSGLPDAQGIIYPVPDLVFLDINMPAMDGWEFLARYDQLQVEQKALAVVVVMLTTSLNPEDEKKARGIPYISGFRCKPLTAAMLDNLLRLYFPDYF